MVAPSSEVSEKNTDELKDCSQSGIKLPHDAVRFHEDLKARVKAAGGETLNTLRDSLCCFVQMNYCSHDISAIDS